jgi:PAS domain S-box-containing protein
MSSQIESALPSQFGAAAAPPTAREQPAARLQRWLRANMQRLLPWALLVLAFAVALPLLLHGQATLALASARVQAGEQTLARLAELHAGIVQAEATHRAHALSGDAALLEPLRQTPPRTEALLAALRPLLSDDPAQFSRGVALAPWLHRRHEQLLSAAEQRQRGGANALAATLAALDNRRALDQAEAVVADIRRAAEQRLVQARSEETEARSSQQQFISAAAVLALAAAGWLTWRWQRTQAQLAHTRRERQHKSERQQRQQATHERLLESPLAAVAFLDREGRIRRLNAAAQALLGLDATQAAGRPLAQAVLPPDQRKTELALEAASHTAAPAVQTWQHRWRHADGRVLHLAWSAQAVAADGSLVCVVHDITEATTLATETRRQADALRDSVATREDAVQRAEAAERRLAEFLATLSRCLRPPLAALLQQAGNGQQGLHGAQDATVTRAWAQVLERTRFAQEATEHVLLLGRMQAGQVELVRDAFDVWDLVSRTAELVRAPADRQGVRLVLQLADDLGYAHGDSRRVEQALLQLLQESVASSAGGELTLAATRDAEGRIHISLTQPRGDGGAASLDELLAPLFDADKPATPEQLTRLLGVAMARTLVSRMGGQLQARLAPPAGCTIELVLPGDTLPGG